MCISCHGTPGAVYAIIVSCSALSLRVAESRRRRCYFLGRGLRKWEGTVLASSQERPDFEQRGSASVLVFRRRRVSISWSRLFVAIAVAKSHAHGRHSTLPTRHAQPESGEAPLVLQAGHPYSPLLYLPKPPCCNESAVRIHHPPILEPWRCSVCRSELR
jgi:hypothetical protein